MTADAERQQSTYSGHRLPKSDCSVLLRKQPVNNGLLEWRREPIILIFEPQILE